MSSHMTQGSRKGQPSTRCPDGVNNLDYRLVLTSNTKLVLKFCRPTSGNSGGGGKHGNWSLNSLHHAVFPGFSGSSIGSCSERSDGPLFGFWEDLPSCPKSFLGFARKCIVAFEFLDDHRLVGPQTRVTSCEHSKP